MTGTPRITGFNHVATLTGDLDRFIAFYGDVFGAVVEREIEQRDDHPRMAIISVGGIGALNVFEVPEEAIIGDRTRIGARGPIDHFAFMTDSPETLTALRDRLVELDASPGVITDFETELSIFFRDPDGMELEVCCAKPDGYVGEAEPPT
jgi:catechol 2,3-dioxygenase-like lactoylglutathione lyase family enzyme